MAEVMIVLVLAAMWYERHQYSQMIKSKDELIIKKNAELNNRECRIWELEEELDTYKSFTGRRSLNVFEKAANGHWVKVQ